MSNQSPLNRFKEILDSDNSITKADQAIRAFEQAVLEKISDYEGKKTRVKEDMKRGSRLSKHRLSL